MQLQENRPGINFKKSSGPSPCGQLCCGKWVSNLFVKSFCWWRFLSFYSEFSPALYHYKDVSSRCSFTLLLLTLPPADVQSCFCSSRHLGYNPVSLPSHLAAPVFQTLFFPCKPLMSPAELEAPVPQLVHTLVFACFPGSCGWRSSFVKPILLPLLQQPTL